MDISPIYESFGHLKKYISKMRQWPEHSDLNRLSIPQRQQILSRSGKKICFMPPLSGKQTIEQKYESRIYLTGEVQTRTNNWHDFFNALVWHIFPRAKSALNLLHYQMHLFESANKIKQRCGLRDAATLFDESGVIVVSSEDALIRLLKDFEWKALFWKKRDEVLSSMRFFVFGHGLYEKTLDPYVGMTGKGIIFHVDRKFLNDANLNQLQSIDLMLELFLLKKLSSSSDLIPIPLLGYPGWAEKNNEEAYYDNKQYFRDKKSNRIIA